MKTWWPSALISMVLLIFTGHDLSAQEIENEADNSRYTHGIGLAAGATSAYGLSYRFFIQRFGFQLTYAPITSTSTGSEWVGNYTNFEDKEITMHTGLTFLFYLVEGTRSNLFAFQSNYYYYHSKERTYSNTPANSNSLDFKETKTYFNHGLGVGVELIIAKKMSLNFMAGYGAFENFERINFTGETGLYYTF